MLLYLIINSNYKKILYYFLPFWTTKLHLNHHIQFEISWTYNDLWEGTLNSRIIHDIIFTGVKVTCFTLIVSLKSATMRVALTHVSTPFVNIIKCQIFSSFQNSFHFPCDAVRLHFSFSILLSFSYPRLNSSQTE